MNQPVEKYHVGGGRNGPPGATHRIVLRLAKRLREALCFTRLTNPSSSTHQTPVPPTVDRPACTDIPEHDEQAGADPVVHAFVRRRETATALLEATTTSCCVSCMPAPAIAPALRYSRHREREVSNPRAAIRWSRSRWPCTCPGRWLPLYVKRLLSNSAGVVHQVRFHSALAPSPFRATSSLLPALPAPIRRIWLDLKLSSRRNPAGAEPQPFSLASCAALPLHFLCPAINLQSPPTIAAITMQPTPAASEMAKDGAVKAAILVADMHAAPGPPLPTRAIAAHFSNQSSPHVAVHRRTMDIASEDGSRCSHHQHQCTRYRRLQLHSLLRCTSIFAPLHRAAASNAPRRGT